MAEIALTVNKGEGVSHALHRLLKQMPSSSITVPVSAAKLSSALGFNSAGFLTTSDSRGKNLVLHAGDKFVLDTGTGKLELRAAKDSKGKDNSVRAAWENLKTETPKRVLVGASNASLSSPVNSEGFPVLACTAEDPSGSGAKIKAQSQVGTAEPAVTEHPKPSTEAVVAKLNDPTVTVGRDGTLRLEYGYPIKKGNTGIWGSPILEQSVTMWYYDTHEDHYVSVHIDPKHLSVSKSGTALELRADSIKFDPLRDGVEIVDMSLPEDQRKGALPLEKQKLKDAADKLNITLQGVQRFANGSRREIRIPEGLVHANADGSWLSVSNDIVRLREKIATNLSSARSVSDLDITFIATDSQGRKPSSNLTLAAK